MTKYGIDVDEEGEEEEVAELVIGAYDVQIAVIDHFQQATISEYENAMFAQCYTAMTSDEEE